MTALPSSRSWILFAAWGCFVAGLLHIICIFAGQAWFDFLGAPPHYGQMMADGDWFFPATVTVGIAAVLFIWAAYARSALEGRKPLPLAGFVCAAVTVIFLIRGAAGIAVLLYVLTQTGPSAFALFHLAASVFVLLLGLGFRAAFKRLRASK